MSEIFPAKARGFASAMVVLSNWGMAFVVTKTFQDMLVSSSLQKPKVLQLLCWILADPGGQYQKLFLTFDSFNEWRKVAKKRIFFNPVPMTQLQDIPSNEIGREICFSSI